jgi:segregation and condensation protein A
MQSVALGLTVQLPKFEGPLALLLYLIRKEEMDIMDIKINEITGQYLDYIKMMKELDLELAGEFVAMAATLIHIKSRMLLPQYDANGEIVESEDPRKELVQRLIEYQKYQEAAHLLYERPLLGRDYWARGIRERLDAKEEDIILEENALFSLITAYRAALRGVKRKIHQVSSRLQSIASRILEIKDRLIVGQKVAMSDLITVTEGRHRQVLITFLSMLELGKMGFIRLFQSDTYQEIYIEAQREIEDAAVSRVEEYDSVRVDMSPETLATAADALQSVDPETEFVLKDETFEEDEQVEMNFGFDVGEIASDADILAAEQELSPHVSHDELNLEPLALEPADKPVEDLPT